MYSLVFLCHKDDLLYWQYYLLGSTGKQFGNTASAIKGPVPDSKDWLLLALHSTAWHRLNVLHANSKSSVLCQILPFQGIFKHSTLNVTIQTVSEQANYSSYLAPFQKEDFARSEQAHMDTHTCRVQIFRGTHTHVEARTHTSRGTYTYKHKHTHTHSIQLRVLSRTLLFKVIHGMMPDFPFLYSCSSPECIIWHLLYPETQSHLTH